MVNDQSSSTGRERFDLVIEERKLQVVHCAGDRRTGELAGVAGLGCGSDLAAVGQAERDVTLDAHESLQLFAHGLIGSELDERRGAQLAGTRDEGVYRRRAQPGFRRQSSAFRPRFLRPPESCSRLLKPYDSARNQVKARAAAGRVLGRNRRS